MLVIRRGNNATVVSGCRLAVNFVPSDHAPRGIKTSVIRTVPVLGLYAIWVSDRLDPGYIRPLAGPSLTLAYETTKAR